jgi:hypothetical protein
VALLGLCTPCRWELELRREARRAAQLSQTKAELEKAERETRKAAETVATLDEGAA